MYVLQLNDMRSPKIEILSPVARAQSVEILEKLMEDEKVTPYQEPGNGPYGPTTWHKVFKKGGPLEWFNTPYSRDEIFVNVGTLEDRRIKAREHADRQRDRILEECDTFWVNTILPIPEVF